MEMSHSAIKKEEHACSRFGRNVRPEDFAQLISFPF